MKLSKLLTCTLVLGALATTLSACSSKDQTDKITFKTTQESTSNKAMDKHPESSYWFPKQLLKWDFNKDPDAKYNVSAVLLAKRVAKKELLPVNKTQDKKMNVVALSIINSSTSGNAPHGINTFDVNTFSYWQYIDKLVYWGGSAGEGIIVPPSPDVIDAAHKNGVPVLGTIFFPQEVSGGKIEWLNQFLQKDAKGNFPIVDKLIEVADKYGFDGWFINQETDTSVTSFDDAKEGKEAKQTNDGLTKKHADLMRELIAQYKKKAKDSEIMWYDSMTSDGKMDWQNALTDQNQDFLVDANMNPVSDSMFMNFWWNTKKLADQDLLKKSNEKAKQLGINPYDLYAGIDVQADGYMTPVRWNLFADKNGKPYTSLGLYAPNWTYTSSSTQDEFESKENSFWVNSKGDPTKGVIPKDTSWAGVSTFEVEQTALTKLPFVTNFSMGNGYSYFIKGKKVSEMDWNNRSLQDILPTYRWIFENQDNKNSLEASMDYTTAYNGGNSLKLRGEMFADKTTTMKLYSSRFKMPKDTVFTTTAKASSPTQLDLILDYSDGTSQTFKGDQKVKKDWTTVNYDMKKAEGKTVTAISYKFKTAKDDSLYELNFGQISATDKPTNNKISVSDLKVDSKSFDEDEGTTAGVCLSWKASDTANLAAYEIYRVNKDGSYSFVGATPAKTHYLNALDRNGEDQTKFVVVPVDIYGNRGKASDEATLTWPDNKMPKADFTASQTLIAPGQEVTFKSKVSANTKKVKWEFEGAKTKTSTAKNPTVKYTKPGTYTVKLTAENSHGKTPLVMKGLITVTPKLTGDLSLLSQGATATASGFTNDSEAPQFAIDGDLSTKWCATGNPPHEITLDLGAVKTISEVKLAHAQAGGENADMNTKAYTIEISTNGKDFTKVARTSNNMAKESDNTFAPTQGRYVKLVVDKPTQGSDTAVRIYEMQVYGLNEALK